MAAKIDKVLVVGAGPCGLLTAIMLAKQGIYVEVLEAAGEVNHAPRGLAYGPAASRVIARAGVLDEVVKRGFIINDVAWRDINGNVLVDMTATDEKKQSNENGYVVLPVGSLSEMLAGYAAESPYVTILWNHKVSGVGQDENKAWTDVTTSTGDGKRIEAEFVIGCDGGTSVVRHSLFGRDFPGFTWPNQLLALNLYYDFNKFGWSDLQWVIDPEDWYLACRINNDGLWRIACPENPDFDIEQIKANLASKLKRMLPGDPEPDQYNVVSLTPYRIHQRCVQHMRKGRILLAGDAAHLNNPMGGLGLTGGVADVGSLVQSLVGIHEGKADMDILDQYDRARRGIFENHTNPTTIANFERMSKTPKEVVETDPFFALLTRARDDPQAMEEMHKSALALEADMTKFYKT